MFDRGGTLSPSYDVIVLAMPPKDIMRFFSSSAAPSHDPQSQADLHRRTNRGRQSDALPAGHRHITLPPDVLRKLRTPAYNGRYSLALWLPPDERFIGALCAAWHARPEPHPIIDMISPQPGGVLVVQSNVELWQRVEGGGKKGGGKGKGGKGKGGKAGPSDIRGGGRDAARSHMVAALEELAGCKMPRAQNAKLLNWRTSQASPPLGSKEGESVVTAEGGRLIFTGDWCVESSFEGCNLAAQAAATAAIATISMLEDIGGLQPQQPPPPPPQQGQQQVTQKQPQQPPQQQQRGQQQVKQGQHGQQFQCASCGEQAPRERFSKNQLSKGAQRRCSGCVGSAAPAS